MADDVGSLLLRAGLVSPDQLAASRKEVTNVGGTVPEQLVQQGHIADETLTSFYRQRLLIPRVNPTDLEKLSSRLLEKVPPDMASEFRCIPIALDLDGNLTVAMSDPSDAQAVDEIAFFTGNYVVRAIATQAQIAWCLAHYYKQKTKLFLGLVADGQLTGEELIEPANSQLATIEMPVLAGPNEDDQAQLGETGPMKTRNPKQARKRAKTEDDPDSNSRKNKKVAKRPSNQMPSPAELFARAGEITSVELQEDHAVPAAGPAVVIAMDFDRDSEVLPVERVPDTAPILLTDVREWEAQKPAPTESLEDPIVLTNTKRKTPRNSKRTSIGLGSVGEAPASSGQVLSPAPAEKTTPAGSGLASSEIRSSASTNSKKKGRKGKKGKKSKKSKKRTMPQSPLVSAIRAQSTDLVGDDWGAPGTTIPPDYIGAMPAAYDDLDSAIPEAIDDGQDTSQMLDPGMSVPVAIDSDDDTTVKNERPQGQAKSTPNDAATSLLVAVRAIDRSDDRGDIVEAILEFLDVSYERSAFLALRQDDLVVWRTHNCAGQDVNALCVTKDSTFRDVIQTRQPYNGRLADSLTKQLARDLDTPDALDILVLPISLRDRVVGTVVALSSFGPINEDHIMVLSQAASEGFERIVLARKK